MIIHLCRFIGSEDPETYFTDTERTRVCYEILETAPYGKRQKGEIGKCIFLVATKYRVRMIKLRLWLWFHLHRCFSGVERLVAEGVFTAAYPLHVVSAKILDCSEEWFLDSSYWNCCENPCILKYALYLFRVHTNVREKKVRIVQEMIPN